MSETELAAGEEVELLERMTAGDAAALARWFQRHKDGVYAFALYRVGKDAELAADATQATFTRAMERLDEFDPVRGPMSAWLRCLARNVIREVLAPRRKGVQLQMVWDRIDETLERALRRIDSELLPETAVEREETRELVEMTLANLSPPHRQVLRAKYLDGQPLEAIARSRNATLDAVKSLLRRARAAFRECFLAIARIEVSDV